LYDNKTIIKQPDNTHTFTYKEEGFDIRVIHINDLKIAKKASAHPRDINDLENLK